MTRSIRLVVNPAAGRGRAARLVDRAVDQLRQGIAGLDLEVVASTSFDHARELTRGAVDDGVDTLLVMGGDGMAHLGLNACAQSRTTLGVIPVGTGNDFCRGVGLPQTLHGAVQSVVDGRRRTIDLSLTEHPDGRTWVGSVVSTGYDAKVNRATNECNLRLGAPVYAAVAIAELAKFSPLHYVLEIDGVRRELDAMFVSVGNAGCFGGGMKICPDADVTDGLLDVTIVLPVTRRKLARILPTVYWGGHVKQSCVEVLRARSVRLEGPDMYLMADGELIGDVPVLVRSVPGALSVHG